LIFFSEIPILSIQPLVENAINHGVMKKTEGGQITVKIFKDADNIIIETTDTGVGMSEKKINQILDDEYSTKGVGLLNIHKRIRKLTGSGLKIKSVANKYTSVSFSIIERKK
ncbi:sensor histidine kinase, partial [Bacillus solimangrovi]|uniref:sensor histidine kinase n=1 Tax=Bacillus solimangrovi TaxID=1305675 RepID=UPI001FDEA3EB